MDISVHNLDIIIRANDYALYNKDKIMLTPDGVEFCHKGIRLLQHIQREFIFYNENNESKINCYSIYCYHKDFIELGLGVVTRNFKEILRCDPFMRKKFAKDEDKVLDKSLININDFGSDWLPLHFNYSGSTIVSRVFNQFIHERMPKGYDISLLAYEEAENIIKNYYLSMSDEQKAAINLLAKHHLAGIITPIFLTNLMITPSEYANAVFNLNLPHFRNERLHKKHLELLENDNFNPPVLQENSTRADFEVVRNEALSAVEYIELIKMEAPSVPDLENLLKNGENYSVEYKSTLRMNLKSGKRDVNVEHASMKTIAGLLNSSGGVLLIGVRDDSSIEGIETDDFDNEDRFSLHFWNLVKSSMGQDVSAFIQTSFAQATEKTVFMVRCTKSTHPVFLRQSGFGEEFYIRMGPSSAKLDISEALQYINERFDKI